MTKSLESKKIDRRKKKGYTRKLAGETHEIFTECVYDLQGAIDYVRGVGVENIFLAGHSTGCQKSIYYLSKKGKQNQVKGVILLAPISDYAASQKLDDRKQLLLAEKKARELVEKGSQHEILPKEIWPQTHDAQRFLSLYTPDSEEEIFTYAQINKIPKTLRRVKIPTLVIYAGSDEYNDRPTGKIASWFKENSKSKDLTVKVINGALHSYKGHEKEVQTIVKDWIKKLTQS